MKIMIVDNFFNNFDIIKDEFKRIPRFSAENHPELDGVSKELQDKDRVRTTWPGERSEDLRNTNRFFTCLFINEFSSKFAGFLTEYPNFRLFTHLRLEKDNVKDFIHRDTPTSIYSMLVYLSETNLNSGTRLYEPDYDNCNEDNMINEIKFVQNRAVIFDSYYPHKTLNSYGEDEDDGRLTLNIFWHQRED